MAARLVKNSRAAGGARERAMKRPNEPGPPHFGAVDCTMYMFRVSSGPGPSGWSEAACECEGRNRGGGLTLAGDLLVKEI